MYNKKFDQAFENRQQPRYTFRMNVHCWRTWHDGGAADGGGGGKV